MPTTFFWTGPILAGLLPVFLFLAALVWLDSYKLVRARDVALALAAGAATAVVALAVNRVLVGALGWDGAVYIRYVAPVVEESLKAIVVAWFLRSQRIGFLVDAVILGFAVGAGFAAVENVHYSLVLQNAPAAVWLVRGCGTAVMHGGATALFALAARTLADRGAAGRPWAYVPGLLLAAAVHSLFNHFIVSPLISTAVIVALTPVLLALLFRRGEMSLRSWLGLGFDADAELLELIGSGRLSESPVGVYLRSLQEKFRGEVVADMLCYMRLHTELALRAKGELLMREHGFATELEPDLEDKFTEMDFLEHSLGPTGRLALQPILGHGGREIWQLRMLGRR